MDRGGSSLLFHHFQLNELIWCEGRLNGIKFGSGQFEGVLEIVNAISSLVIVFFGCWGLFAPPTLQGPLIMVTMAILAADGFWSATYHATNWYGPGQGDSDAMLIAMCTATIAVIDETMTMVKLNDRVRSVIIKCAYLFFALFLTTAISLASSVNPPPPGTWEAFFVAPVALILAYFVFMLIASNCLKKIQLPGSPKMRFQANLLLYFFGGFALLGFAGWLIDRYLCSPVIVWFYGHGWWHLFMSYGMMCGLSFVSYIRADNFGFAPNLTLVLWFLPRVTWERPPNNTFHAKALASVDDGDVTPFSLPEERDVEMPLTARAARQRGKDKSQSLTLPGATDDDF